MRKSNAKLNVSRVPRTVRLFVAERCLVRDPVSGMQTAEPGTEVVTKLVPEEIVGSQRLYFVDGRDDPTPAQSQTVTDAIRARALALVQAEKTAQARDAHATLDALRARQRLLNAELAAAEGRVHQSN
jgi:hypothetical protein